MGITEVVRLTGKVHRCAVRQAVYKIIAQQRQVGQLGGILQAVRCIGKHFRFFNVVGVVDQ